MQIGAQNLPIGRQRPFGAAVNQECRPLQPWSITFSNPLDTAAFNTLVKTAAEVLRRHDQQLQAQLHKEVIVNVPGRRIVVSLDIVPDDEMPSATLSASDGSGETLAQVRVAPGYKLDRASAEAWVASDFERPR